jgi:Sigma-70, region 4
LDRTAFPLSKKEDHVPKYIPIEEVSDKAALDPLEALLQREAAPQEIAEETGLVRRADETMADFEARALALAATQPKLPKVNLQDRMRICLAKLSPEHREIFHLVFQSRMSHRRAGEHLGISEEASRARYHRMIVELGGLMRAHIPPHEVSARELRFLLSKMIKPWHFSDGREHNLLALLAQWREGWD